MTDPIVSYAQNYEDVRLLKALEGVAPRTYVDVGAAHPVNDSVTRLLYERGWRGLNVEPGPLFDTLAANRPWDVNVRTAVSSRGGMVRFAIASPHPELSAIADVFTARDAVSSVEVVEVEATGLADLLDERWTLGEIGVLKVDVEGAEVEVLASNDWTRFRPWVVVVEAIAPVSHEPVHGVWESMLLDAGYLFAHFDGVNRFYARDDRPELVSALAQPVSAADYVVRYDFVHARQGVQDVRRLATLLDEAQRQQARATATLREDVARREAAAQRRLIELDRAAKEAATKVEQLTMLLVERSAQADGAASHVRALESELDAIRRSRVVRVGFVLHRWFRPVRPVFARLAPALRGARLRRLGSPRRMREAYAGRTAAGSPLETVRSGRPLPAVTESGLAVSAMYARLRESRTNGARLLDPGEVEQIRSSIKHGTPGVTDAQPGDELLALAAMLASTTPGTRGSVAGGPGRDLVLIDGRALQVEQQSGIVRHAQAVVREVVRQLPPGLGVSFLPCDRMGPLRPEDASLATEEWVPTKMGRVALYLQLAPFVNTSDDGDIEILLDPSIRKVSVFLDDIQGIYPAHFVGNEWEFWFYQLGVERLKYSDVILALSETSTAELCAILNGRADGPEIVVSGALNRVAAPGRLPRSVSALGEFVVVTGNPLPHKNIAAAVAGSARTCGRPDGPGLVVLSSTVPSMVPAILDLALELGVPPSRVVVTGTLPDDQLAAVVAGARAVIVPSFHEGFSLPVIEALDSGTPVVASRIDAHRELLGDGGWMFDPADPVDLHRALSHVLADPERILGEQRGALTLRYRPERFTEAITRVLSLLGHESGGPGTGPAKDDAWSAMLKDDDADRTFLGLCKVCEVEDFVDHRLRTVMRDVFSHEVVRLGEGFPQGREYRKYWEVSMAVLAFKQLGLLSRSATILGIGAGNEPTNFYLTRHAGRVIATDLYESPGWEESADESMIANPGWHWPFHWEPERLEVRHMDALSLDLPDCSIDGIYSSSSIEHFGSHEAVGRALDEAHRVLKPGGILSVSTEYRLLGLAPGIPGALMFDSDDIGSLFVGNRDWELVDPFDRRISRRTLETASSFKGQLNDQLGVIARYGGLFTHITEYTRYPHVALHIGTRMFTSMHLALRKSS